MLDFREFEAGPDPFGRKLQVLFKWLQTAISIRHSDTVDVKFILVEQKGEPESAGNAEIGMRMEKTIALPHADLLRVSRESRRAMDDPWCARLAMLHLLHLVETGEDMEKQLVTVSSADIARYAAEIALAEGREIHAA